MQADRSITIIGMPSFQVVAFNQHSGKLTVTADVECDEKVFYKGLPILHLFFNQFEDGVAVDEDYSYFVPYLKAIPAFRAYIRNRLLKFLGRNTFDEKQGDIFYAGIETYLAGLNGFSEAKSLIRQAKSCANALSDRNKDSERKARAVLAALGVTPHVDVGFEVREE